MLDKFFQALFSGLVIFGVLMPLSAQAEKRVALVIGNDRYLNFPPQKQLEKAVNDAEAVGDTLARLGFTVVRGQNLSRQRTIEQLSAFTRQLEPGDIAAFFFAGHGVAVGGVNYLLPSDMPSAESETIVRGNALSETEVTAEIQSRGVRVALLVLDACRDNPLPRSGTRSLGNTKGLAESKPARGVFTIYSAGIGQSALDRLEANDPNRNSVFTRVFIQQLARSDLHLGDLAVDVREKVAALALKAKDNSGQLLPHEQTPAYYDQTIGGRIYLASRSGVSEPSKPVAPPPAAAPPAQVALVPPVVPPPSVTRGDPKLIRSISTRGYNGSTYVEGEFNRDETGRWIETNRLDAKTRLVFAEQKNTPSEVLMYDDLRDLYLRFDLTQKRLFFRMGKAGQWVPFYKIETVSNVAGR